MIEAMMQFGVAGLMGALWVWERSYSRRREEELSQAHRKLITQGEHLQTLVRLVRVNTQAMVQADRTGRRICELLEEIGNEIRKQQRAA